MFVSEDINIVRGISDKIVQYPNPILAQICAEVIDFNKLNNIGEQMIEMMYKFNGIGIAAPQVGIKQRIIAFDDKSDNPKKRNAIVMVNPIIIEREGMRNNAESCLSLYHPRIFGYIPRAHKVKVEYRKINGESAVYAASGLIARVLQHEIDHLDGVLFIDKLGPVKRNMLNRFIKELEK